ncbi:hypothetical protein Q7C36_023073 [Tachysurus vachellii]|uniref:Uncharacterized protein n=1 Tax=Tachysurus vachellii TaxID=175792 RepID=A0AA88IXW8_TACVA|nr:hypothetical protein Q7C36_023073 [Tachysurus vachellii]
MKTTRQLPVRGSKMSTAGPSSIRRQNGVVQQTLARKPPTLKVHQTVFSMYDVSTNPKEFVPFIKASRHGSRMKLSGERSQRSGAGPAAKDTEKPRLLSKRPRRDLIRAKVSMEETVRNSQIKLPDNRVPGKFITSTPKDLSQMTKRLDEGVRPSAKPKVEVKDMTPRAITVQKKHADQNLRDALKTDKAAEDKTEVKPQNNALRDKIARDILHYIQSASYKKKLTERFMEEISVHLENALSQTQELQHAMRDQSGVQPEFQMFTSTARSCRQEGTSELGFSLCVTSLIGFSLIESRDEIIECIKSVSSKTPSVTKTSTEIVKNVFESILASLIDVDTLNPEKDIDRLAPDSMTSTLASHVFNVKRACECILQRINLKESQYSHHEPADRGDKVLRPADESDLQASPVTDVTAKSPLEEVTAPSEKVHPSEIVPSEVDEQDLHLTTTQDHAFMKIIKKVKNIWTSKNQDESSEAEVKDEHEEQIISDDFIPPPQTSATEQDLKPDYVAEEQLLPELVVDLDQPSSSEETVPSEVDEQDLQLIGHQELTSPVPSPDTSEMADSPKGSATSRTLSSTKASTSSIPDKSDTESSTIIQKSEDVFKPTLSLSDMVKAVSLESEEKEEVKEILLTESKELDHDHSSGPEVKGKDEIKSEDERISDDFIPPPQTSPTEEDLRPEEEAEEQLQDDSDVDHEQVLATASEEKLPSEATSQNSQLIRHQKVASPVPSPRSSEMAESPRGSATIRTGRKTKASAPPNIPLSIPDKSDTELSTIIQKREDLFKQTLSLNDMVKAVSLKSAEKEDVKEILLTEFKKLSLLSSLSLDQDQSSGPEVTGKEEEEEEEEEKEEEEEEEEEEKSIMAVSEPISHLDDPLASRDEMSDSDLAKSIHEKVTVTSGEVSNLEDTPEKATTEVPVPLSIRYKTDIDMVMCPKSLDQDQSSSIEEDLRPEEGAEEQLSDDSDVDIEVDVDIEQILATLSETAAQDLRLIGHQEHPGLVPSPPSTKKPDSTKGSARRKTRPTKKFSFLSSMAKGMKKTSGCFSTTSDDLSLDSSRTFDLKEATEESTEHGPATSDDVSKKCFLV